MATKTGFIGAGAVDISVKNKTTGLFGGWFPIANTEKLEYTPKGKTENISSMSEASFGQSFDSELIAEPGEIAFTVSEMNAQILAMTIAASLSASAITAGSVIAELHTVSSGDAVLADKNYLSNLVVLQTAMACTLTAASNLVTATAHGLVNGQIVSFSEITTTTGIVINTDYYVIEATADTFKVSATLNGAALTLTGNGTAVLDAKLVAGTDYKMISNNHFEIVKAGLTSKVLSLAYSYLASEWAVMDMGAENHTIRVRFNGVNRRSGKRIKALWADITVDSGVSLALLSSKFQPFDIKGVVNVDKDATSATYGKIGTLEIQL
jgi:hypothetical protein